MEKFSPLLNPGRRGRISSNLGIQRVFRGANAQTFTLYNDGWRFFMAWIVRYRKDEFGNAIQNDVVEEIYRQWSVVRGLSSVVFQTASSMYNPFPLLNTRLLEDKIKEGKRFFVRQTFVRGMEPRLKATFLFRAYEGEEKEIALVHMDKIAKDPHAFMYDATMPEHLEKLHIAAKQPFGFKIYYAGKKGMDWKPPVAYQIKMRKYIRDKHPDWGNVKEGPQVEVGLMEEFGELFLKLSYEDEEELIPFVNIENY